MTNINENLQKMLSARYGRDMRQAIHDSINAINNKVDQYDNTEIKKQVEELQNSMISEEQIDELLTENNIAEINNSMFNTENIEVSRYENKWIYNGVLGIQQGYLCFCFRILNGERYVIERNVSGVLGIGFSSDNPFEGYNNYVLVDYSRHDGISYDFVNNNGYKYCSVFAGKLENDANIVAKKLNNVISDISNKLENLIQDITIVSVQMAQGYISTTTGKIVPTKESDEWTKRFVVSSFLPSSIKKIETINGYEFRINRYTKDNVWVDKLDFVSEYSDFDEMYKYRIQIRNEDNSVIAVEEAINNTNIYVDALLQQPYLLECEVKNGWSKLKDRISNITDDYIDKNGLTINGVEADYEEVLDYVLNHNCYSYHGKISKQGNKIIDKNGNVMMLQGIGTHSISEYNSLYTAESVRTLKYYGINLIRISVYLSDIYASQSEGRMIKGWLNHSDELKPIIENLIDITTDEGMYILLDFHTYHAFDGGDCTVYQTEQEEFFRYFSDKYSENDNILYELHNEPYQNTASELLPSVASCCDIIRSNNADAIIVCGHGKDGSYTANTVFNTKNNLDIFISPHLYTGEQTTDNIKNLVTNNIPIFVSEWGNSSLSGSDIPNDSRAYDFFSFLHTKKIANALWKWTYQDMDTSVLIHDIYAEKYAYKYGGYADGMLSHNGRLYFRNTFNYMIKDVLK